MIAIMRPALSRLFELGRSLVLCEGAILFRAGESVRWVHFVASGEVLLVRHTKAGQRLILQRARAGSIIAEASVYAAAYHCDGVCPAHAELKRVPKRAFLSSLVLDPALAEVWAATLARATQAARIRAEIRSLPRLSDRLDAWLEEGGSLPAKGHMQDVAAEIGVTREALYRELAKRRRCRQHF
jgi:CRP-like cAMP-binding protein